MTPDQGEVLSAFVDGVAVDPERLAEALTDPDALAWLVTCARLRAEISADGRRPSPAFYERMHAVLKPRGIRRFFIARRVSVPWPIAAGAAAATLIAGLWAGPWVHSGSVARMPPPVTVLTPATPGLAPPPVPAPITQASLPGSDSSPRAGPPRPTRILRFASAGEGREGL